MEPMPDTLFRYGDPNSTEITKRVAGNSIHKYSAIKKGVHMKRSIQVFVLLIGLIFSTISPGPVLASPEGVRISGTVYYSTIPMSGIKVDLIPDPYTNPPQATTISASDGSYSFDNVSAGKYWLITHGPTSDYIQWQGSSHIIGNVNLRYNLYIGKIITTLSPSFNQTVEANPVLCWQGLPEATRYTIQVNRNSDWELIEFPQDIESTCYKTKGNFDNGVTYNWGVEGYNASGVDVGSSSTSMRFVFQSDPILSTVTPANPTTVTSIDNDISISIPAGSVAQTDNLTYQRINLIQTTNGLRGIDKTYSVNLTKASDGTLVDLLPLKTYIVTITYQDAELGIMDESKLALYYLDGDNWVKEPTSQVDVATNTITANPSHFSAWAVMGEEWNLYLPSIQTK
jgi:hypothetical protein